MKARPKPGGPGPTVGLLALALLVGAAAPGWAQDATAILDERIDRALAAYKTQVARIAEEKVPLLTAVADLEKENLQLRESVQTALTTTEESNRRFEALQNRRDELRLQNDFAEKFLQEFLDGFESRLHPAEDQLHLEVLMKWRREIDAEETAPGPRLERQLQALQRGLDRAEAALGGARVGGRAIGPDGRVLTGDMLLIGPVAYFVSAPGSEPVVAGVLEHRPGTVEPAVLALEGGAGDSIRRFAATGQGELPLDVSLGNAVTALEADTRLIDHVGKGGPVGWAILGLGLVAVVLGLVKIADLGRFRTVESGAVGRIVTAARADRADEARSHIGPVAAPVREMLELGIENVRANAVLLEELMLSVILRKRPTMERFLPFLAITAAAAPLLGLLGTVVGMIRTFALITVFGTGDPRALSSGISEALVTTELGLMVAIPALIMHGVFSRMIKRRFGDMERVAFEFVKTLSLQQSRESESGRA